MGDFDHSSNNVHRSKEPKSKEVRTQDTKVEFKVRTEDTKGEFSEDEEMLIARMFNLVGERWSLIAGRIPGRTAEEIEKYWTSRHSSTSQKER